MVNNGEVRNASPRTVRREAVIVGSLVAGFVGLVAVLVGAYALAADAFHVPLRRIGVPAVLGSLRMPAIGPADLVLGAAVVVMIAALVLLFIHDARSERGAHQG
jgi:hypothetical protein